MKRTLPAEQALLLAISSSEYAQTLVNICVRFLYMNSLEDALLAIQKSVDLYQQLAANHPGVFKADLALSLHHLSLCLFKLGHHKRAL